MDESADKERQAVRFVVRGRVQGVGFRWWTHREAERLGVNGSVRNVPDGSVEVLAAATGDALERFERSLRRGPPMSDVESIEATPWPMRSPDDGFRIVR